MNDLIARQAAQHTTRRRTPAKKALHDSVAAWSTPAPSGARLKRCDIMRHARFIANLYPTRTERLVRTGLYYALKFDLTATADALDKVIISLVNVRASRAVDKFAPVG
jgi:hypothetical protein